MWRRGGKIDGKKRTNRTARRGGEYTNYNSSEEVGPLAIDAVGWWWNNVLNRDADTQYRNVYELGSGDVKRKGEKKESKTRKEILEIFVKAVSGKQKTKVLGMTSRGSEGGSEEDGDKEIDHWGNNEESPLADTRTTLGIEWMR